MPNPQLEYLEDMGSRDYPFVSRYSTPAVNQVFADLYVVYSTNTNATLTLDSIDFVSDEVINFVIKDGTTVVMNSSAVGIVSSPNNLWAGKWRAFEYYNPNNNAHVKFVLDNDILLTLLGSSYSTMALGILNRNVEIRPLRIDSITVPLFSPLTNTSVNLEAGYNIKMKVGTVADDIRAGTTITIDAIPGAGFGTFKPDDSDCADAATALKSINGISPNTYGNFLLGSSDCIWATNDHTNHEIRLHNDCRLCYDCADVFGSYSSLYDLNTYAISLRQRISDLCVAYNNKLVDLKKFRDSLNVPSVTHWFVQTDYEAFDIRFRVQCGNKAIKLVVIHAEYAAADGTYTINSVLSPYSGYYKLPTFSHNPIPGFNGMDATYDATASPANTKLQAGTYGYWYWNMQFFTSNPAKTQVKITWYVNLTFTDSTTQNTGTVVSYVNIVPQDSSS